jgi:hypothetical protein
MNRILTEVSRVVRFNSCHSKPHSPISGYASPFHQGVPIPPSSRSVVLPYQFPPHPYLAIPSSVQNLSCGCRYLPIARQGLLTHLSLLASSRSPEPHTATATPALHPYPQPQAIADPGGLDFGFPPVAENFSLPATDPTSAYEQTRGGCKWMSCGKNLTRELTICDIVGSRLPPLDQPCFDLPAPDLTIVSGSIVSAVPFLFTIL